MAGLYSGKTISSYVHGVWAWHILHGQPWILNDNEIDALLKAADNLTPSTAKKKKRQPYTVDFIMSLLRHLDANDPLDAAVRGCLTVAFYTIARVGEFTIPNLNAFVPAVHIKCSDVHPETDRNRLHTIVFHLPRTKSSPAGEDVSCARQHGNSDPKAALHNHYHVNEPPPDAALFPYKHNKGHRPLMKSKFIAQLAQAAKAGGLNPLQGHGIRIGTTLEYLLCNIPFDVVKTMGRWVSNAFQLYLCKHAQILALYLQATPILQNEFLCYAMPPVR